MQAPSEKAVSVCSTWSYRPPLGARAERMSALLYDLERVAPLLRNGGEPFNPDRDRLAFARYLIDAGCQPPPDSRQPLGGAGPR